MRSAEASRKTECICGAWHREPAAGFSDRCRRRDAWARGWQRTGKIETPNFAATAYGVANAADTSPPKGTDFIKVERL